MLRQVILTFPEAHILSVGACGKKNITILQ